MHILVHILVRREHVYPDYLMHYDVALADSNMRLEYFKTVKSPPTDSY